MRNRRITTAWTVLAAGLLFGGAMARAEGNIDPAKSFAWSENQGWINFAPANGGVTVNVAGYLSGYAWAENIGWIKLGNNAGGPYGNTTANDWGVNMNGSGKLSGYAWSENAGWINFFPSYSQVTINKNDGTFDGYAWAENIGWVHFKNASPAYNVRTKANLVAGTVVLFR